MKNFVRGYINLLEFQGLGLRAAVAAALAGGFLIWLVTGARWGGEGVRCWMFGAILGFAVVAAGPVLRAIRNSIATRCLDVRPLMATTWGLKLVYGIVAAQMIFAPIGWSHGGREFLRNAGVPYGSQWYVVYVAIIGMSMAWAAFAWLARTDGIVRLWRPAMSANKPVRKVHASVPPMPRTAARAERAVAMRHSEPQMVADDDEEIEDEFVVEDPPLREPQPVGGMRDHLDVPDLDPHTVLRVPNL